jgi:hypothetical protein
VAAAGASRGWGKRIDICRGGNTCNGYLGASASIAAESGHTTAVTGRRACGGYLDTLASIMGERVRHGWSGHIACAQRGDDDAVGVERGAEDEGHTTYLPPTIRGFCGWIGAQAGVLAACAEGEVAACGGGEVDCDMHGVGRRGAHWWSTLLS